ncbi:MAG TPA: bifunctional ornithine acetyltransferase/N-acetylglutamate synthase, partial [Phenylobacterium sp.]|nr:bifunctional ornithine acetyltransferase/N-acetylglutamate synthase [Phenylobacterium sp.]
MSRKPRTSAAATASKALEVAAKPVEVVGQTLERAFDPLTSALKRAALRRADRQARQFDAAPAAEPAAAKAKAAGPISPLAVPFPAIPPIAGVELATGRAGFYRQERDDLLVLRFPQGASCAGVFTRHGVGSAPVDWCKRHLQTTKGEGVQALVVNAGCANSFTGKPGADAVRRVCSAAAKRFDCRQRDVMVASTGVIGVLLDDARIVHRLPEIEHRLAPDGWANAAQAIMTTDTFAKGSYAQAVIDGHPVKIAGICKGSGMIAPDMATMLAFVVTDAAISPAVLQILVSLYTRNTFNAVTVDGDRSTNDTLLMFATGKSGAPRIGRAGDRRLADFRDKLE